MQLDAAKLAGTRHGLFAALYLLVSVAVGTVAAGLGVALAHAQG